MKKIFILGFGLYYGGTGRGLVFIPCKFIWDRDSPYQNLSPSSDTMMVVIDEKKEVKTSKEELQARIDALGNLLVRKKGSKKDYEWVIGLANTFEVYTIL